MSISLVPAEVKQMIFGCLPVEEQFKAMAVCKEWAEVLGDLLHRNCWKPNFEQFGLGDPPRIQPYEDGEIKSAVVAHLQKYKELPDAITKLINEDGKLMDKDAQLASVIGCDSVSLQELKQKPRIERMLLVMRGLKKDCTALFIYLTKRHQESYAAILKASLRVSSHKSSDATTHKFHAADPCLSLIHKYIKEPPGPFNAPNVMFAVCPLVEICSSQDMVRNICAEIVKSRPNLTDFFNGKVDLLNYGLSYASGTDFIHGMLKPRMDRYNPDVTDDDWRACGLTLPL